MKNFKRKLFIFISLFFLFAIVGAVGGGLLALAIKQEPHNVSIFWTSLIMLSLGFSGIILSPVMIYSIVCQNKEAKQEAIKTAHEVEVLPLAKAYLKDKFGYDDTNSKIYCKEGKVYCRPITNIKEIIVEITID